VTSKSRSRFVGWRFAALAQAVTAIAVTLSFLGQLQIAGPAGAASRGVAKGVMLRLSDLPKGWTQVSTTTTSTTSRTLLATIGPCDGAGVVNFSNSPSRTRAFKKTATPALTVFEGVTRFGSTTTAASAWAILTNSKTPGCTGAAFAKHLTSTPTFIKTGLTISTPLVTKLVTTRYGADTVSFRFRYTVKGAKGLSFTTRIQFLAAIRGTYLVQLFVTGLHPSTSLLRKLMTAAAKRVG